MQEVALGSGSDPGSGGATRERRRVIAAGDASLRNLSAQDRVVAAAALGGLRATLRPHQRVALEWMVAREHLQANLELPGAGAHLWDGMGLGKTIESLALICFALSIRDNAKAAARFPPWGPQLIVVPVAVIESWRNTILDFSAIKPSQIVVYHGARRRKLVPKLQGAVAVLTTYGTLQSDVLPKGASAPDRGAALLRTRWGRVWLDEVHECRNSGNKLALVMTALRQSQSAGRPLPERTPFWGLTGTPIHNRVADLGTLNALIELPAATLANARWLDAHKDDESVMASFRSNYVLVRGKEALDLPPIYRVTHRVPLTRAEYTAYAHIYGEANEAFKAFQTATGRDRLSAFNIVLVKLMRMRQCITHAGLTLGGRVVRAHLEGKVRAAALARPSSKLRAALALVQQHTEHRFLVFSEWTSALHIAEAAFEAAGVPTMVYSGALSAKERSATLAQWRRGKARVLLVSLMAGGVGLTLTEATRVVFLDLWYTPAAMRQAEDRAHRIGQKYPVTVHTLVSTVPVAPVPGLEPDDPRDGGAAHTLAVAAGRTIDHCVLALHRQKQDLATLLVRGLGALQKAQQDYKEGLGEREMKSLMEQLALHAHGRASLRALREEGERRIARRQSRDKKGV